MDKTKIVYQINGNGTRYAGITLNQLAKAMWSGWKTLDGMITTKQVKVDFASDTTFEDDVSNHHGLLLQAPFDSLMLITGAYGGYDFGSAELAETEDELGIGTETIIDKFHLLLGQQTGNLLECSWNLKEIVQSWLMGLMMHF